MTRGRHSTGARGCCRGRGTGGSGESMISNPSPSPALAITVQGERRAQPFHRRCRRHVQQVHPVQLIHPSIHNQVPDPSAVDGTARRSSIPGGGRDTGDTRSTFSSRGTRIYTHSQKTKSNKHASHEKRPGARASRIGKGKTRQGRSG